ncbi:MAG: hypothetical protein NC924_10530, partial [Candidatus Omnitrophica bacterium]|nr:hypothetical protein [Candidatus Omnitrophota bacterium]
DPSLRSSLFSAQVSEPVDMPRVMDRLERYIERMPVDVDSIKELAVLRLMKKVIAQNKAILPCVAGSSDGVLFCNGDVAICEPLRPFANIYDYDLHFPALWRDSVKNKQLAQAAGCFCTHPCHLASALLSADNARLLIDEHLIG